MGEWKRVKFEDIFSFLSGKAKPQESGIYPIYGSNGIIGSASDFMYENAFIIGRVGAVGELRYCKGKFWASDNTIVAKLCCDYVDEQFSKFLLSSSNLKSEVHGSVQPLITKGGLRLIEAMLPPLPTQRRIAAVLSSLDDKIENNRKICANLEAQAQAIFKSWFVDFEPFGGKMPQGWKEVPLSEVADFYGGYSYKGSELHESDCAMATIKNFERGGGFKLDGFKEIVPSSKLKSFQEVELFDTLVAHTDLTQKAEVIGNAEVLLSKAGYDRIIMSMDLVRVLPKGGMSKYLLAALLKNQAFKNHCLRYVNGTTVLHLSKAALHDYSLMLPEDLSLLSKVSDFFESVYRGQAILIDETHALATTREALLPKLMSGEIDVEKVKVA